MDKTQHEYLAGKLKLQNTEKRQSGRKKENKNIPEGTGGTRAHL